MAASSPDDTPLTGLDYAFSASWPVCRWFLAGLISEIVALGAWLLAFVVAKSSCPSFSRGGAG